MFQTTNQMMIDFRYPIIFSIIYIYIWDDIGKPTSFFQTTNQIYIYTYIYIHIYTYIYTYIYTHIYIYIIGYSDSYIMLYIQPTYTSLDVSRVKPWRSEARTITPASKSFVDVELLKKNMFFSIADMLITYLFDITVISLPLSYNIFFNHSYNWRSSSTHEDWLQIGHHLHGN